VDRHHRRARGPAGVRRLRSGSLVLAILQAIAAFSDDDPTDLDRLARRYFALFRPETLAELREALDPDAVLGLRAVQPGAVLRGRDEIVGFLEQELARRLWQTVVHVCTPLDDARVVVEGRIRWVDDDHVMRDDARFWGLEFRDGLLLRSLPARSAVEAEALLSTSS